MLSSCKICGNEFGTYAALVSHTRWKHGQTQPRKHECPICQATFRDSFGVKRHVQGVHSSSHVERTTSCPLCDFSATKKALKTHFQAVHGINMVEETLMFNDVNAFKSWKECMESDTHSRYVKHRASKKMKDGTTTSYFYCYKDGQFKSHSKGLRPLRRMGSNKMNAYCPASLKVEESNGHVLVLFRKTHIGHSDFEKVDVKEVVEVQEFDETKEDNVNDCVDDLHAGQNDEAGTTVTDNSCHIDPLSNDSENVAIVIEVPNCSEDILLKKKHIELERLVEIMNSIKTNDGLEAFRQHIEPLQSIVDEAEKRWCTGLSVHILEDSDIREDLIKNSCQADGILTNVQVFNTQSITKAMSEEVQLTAGIFIPDYQK